MAELIPLQMLSAVLSLTCHTEGWTLHEPGDDTRIFRYPVTFEAAFPVIPLLQVALCGLDVGNEDAARVKVRAVEVGTGGFVLEVETWKGSKVYGVDVSWFALGSA